MKIVTMFLISLLLAACQSAQVVSRISCGAPKGVPESKLLLLGEMHGSAETPEISGIIACAYAMKNKTALGLEIPTSEQPALDSYMSSTGDFASKNKLLSSPFWQNNKDGRSSAAMFELIEYTRHIRQRGVPISVFAFDGPRGDFGASRDAALAGAIRDFHRNNPGVLIVALMGNIHASLTPIQMDGREIVTTGTILQDLNPESILVAYREGTIWACMPGCGVHEIKSEWGIAREPGFANESPQRGYGHAYVLPNITASPPAVDVSHGG